MNRRLEVLGKIDVLEERHCKTCPDNPRRIAKRTNTGCRSCPIGIQISNLGEKLTETIHERKGDRHMAKTANITKDEYLSLRASGKSRKEIAKAKEYTLVHLETYWLKKWGIRDPQQEELALLESTRVVAPPPVVAEKPELREKEVTGLIKINTEREMVDLKAAAAHWQEAATAKDAEIERLEKQMSGIRGMAKKASAEVEQLREQVEELNEEYDRHMSGMQSENERLRDEVQEWVNKCGEAAQVHQDRCGELITENERLRARIQAAEAYAEGVPRSDPSSTYQALVASGVIQPAVTPFERIGKEVGALVAEKNAAYGDSFAKSGAFLRLLYPNGIGPDQYADSLCVIRIFDKLMRIATRKGAFGESPYRDIVGYGILGVHMDGEVR
ncbi:MAG: hypothetical protein K0Q59_1795 [Paenibacillus sp.]|jgi:hypothetical protein|nr:hypothetical protein [Paenibacillus sp.]